MKTLFKPSRIVLSIGDDGIVAVPPEGHAAHASFVSSNDKSAMQKISAFVAGYPDADIVLLADTLSLDFRRDDLPSLNFLDRAKLAKRRLKQAFPSARLISCLNFKKAPNRVLMIGLHESNPVFAWADRLHIRLPRIALLPVEGARLMARLMPEASDGWAMMVSRQKSGGFRQIVSYKDDLVLTRLTPLPSPDGRISEPDIVARDIKASLDYLSRQGLRSPKELSVLLLMPGDIHETAALENLSLKSVRSLPPAQAAQNLGLSLPDFEDDGAADVLFAVDARDAFRLRLPLAPPDIRNARLTQDIRFWGTRIAQASLAATLVLTFWRAGSLAATLYQAQKETSQLAEARAYLDRERSQAAPLTEPLGRMRQALERRHIFEKPSPLPWPGLNELADGLDEKSALDSLEWRSDSDGGEKFIVGLRLADATSYKERADAVDAFSGIVRDIAQAMPDFAVAHVKPPYPALPQDSVTSRPVLDETPSGEIVLERKEP